MEWSAFISGFTLQFGLIMSLGVQNLYIIRKGLSREHTFPVALTCILCESILVVLALMSSRLIGEMGEEPIRYMILAAGWVLIAYGVFVLWGVLKKPKVGEELPSVKPSSLRGSMLMAVGFSILNPQALVESLVIIGGVGATFGQQMMAFALGAFGATTLWLFGLAALSHYVLPSHMPRKYRLGLEAVSGAVMIGWGFHLGF